MAMYVTLVTPHLPFPRRALHDLESRLWDLPGLHVGHLAVVAAVAQSSKDGLASEADADLAAHASASRHCRGLQEGLAQLSDIQSGRGYHAISMTNAADHIRDMQ